MPQHTDIDGSRTQGRSQLNKSKNRAAPNQKPFMMQKIHRRDLILLVGVLSFACFSVITVGLLILRYNQSGGRAETVAVSTPGPQPTHTVTYVQITGLSQYKLAEARAREWADDAQLVSAQANWPRVVYEDQVGEPGQWTYRFYSPAKKRLFIVKAEPDGQVLAIEHVVPITLPPPLLDISGWSIDSPAALAIWLDYGGADLIRYNPGLEVLIQLRNADNGGNPVWVVIGTDERTQDIHIVVIDTGNGAVISTNEPR
jgi:hypothetical protein